MATKKKTNVKKTATKKELSAKAKALLIDVCNATNEAGQGMYAPVEAKELLAEKLVEADLKNVDPDTGNVFVWATEKGFTEAGIEPEKFEAEEADDSIDEVEEKPEFLIAKGIPLPRLKKSNAGMVKYPFDDLEIGDSFHMCKTKDCPEPIKKLGSSASNANRRWRNEDGTQERLFTVRTVGKDDPQGPGARVWRIDVPVNEDDSDAGDNE